MILLKFSLYLLTVVQEISKLINTGLDDETLSICLKLCENGVNPEALALAIKELRKEASKLKVIQANFMTFLL